MNTKPWNQNPKDQALYEAFAKAATTKQITPQADPGEIGTVKGFDGGFDDLSIGENGGI